jgi:AraC-like DNA-binding protein
LRNNSNLTVEKFIDVLKLLEKRVNTNTLLTKNTKIEANTIFTLIKQISQKEKSDKIYFDISNMVIPSSIGILGYLISHSNNLNEALEKLSVYYKILGDSLEIRYKNSSLFIYLDENINHFEQKLKLHIIAIITLLKNILYKNLEFEYCNFNFKSPVCTKEYEKQFGKNLNFQKEHTNIVFTKQCLQYKTKFNDETLLILFEQEAKKMLDLVSSNNFKEEVSKEIIKLISLDELSLQNVAKRLTLHERTLQKRLKEEKSSYTKIVKEVRIKLVKYYSSKNFTANELSTLLGFSTTNSFLKAFKSWFNKSFEEFKNKSL